MQPPAGRYGTSHSLAQTGEFPISRDHPAGSVASKRTRTPCATICNLFSQVNRAAGSVSVSPTPGAQTARHHRQACVHHGSVYHANVGLIEGDSPAKKERWRTEVTVHDRGFGGSLREREAAAGTTLRAPEHDAPPMQKHHYRDSP